MDSEHIAELLTEVRQGKVSVAQALARLRHLPFEDLDLRKSIIIAPCVGVSPKSSWDKAKNQERLRVLHGLYAAAKQRACNPAVTCENDSG